MSKESKLLKEAIADAKALKESAIASARIAMEEAFTPKLQSMISAKLQNEMDEFEDEDEIEPSMEEEFGEEDEELGMESEPEMGSDPELEMEPEMESEPEMETEPEMEPELEDEEDVELESVIRELEDEPSEDEAEFTDEPEAELEDEEEEIDIQEVINALREFDNDEDGTPEEGPAMEEEVARLTSELEEAITTIHSLRSSINETNLLNAKLLLSTKLFKSHAMNESQKTKVIENLDRAQTIREVKLVYATLAESLTKISKRPIKEGASRPTPSTAPSKAIINENSLGDRWAKLANIIK